MNQQEAEKMLKKEKLTGRELGILEVENMCFLFPQIVREEPKPRNLFDVDAFQRAFNAMKSDEDKETYRGYLALYDWIRCVYYRAQFRRSEALRRAQLLNEWVDKKNSHKKTVKAFAFLRELGMFTDDRIEVEFISPEKEEDKEECIRESLNLIPIHMAWIEGYNEAISMMGDFYGVDSLTTFQVATSDIYDVIEQYMDTRKELLKILEADGSEGKSCAPFEELKIKPLKVGKTTRNKVVKLLEGFKAFTPKHYGDIEFLLCQRRN